MIQHLTCLPSELGSSYFACAGHNLEKAYDKIQEIGSPIGLVCTGTHFMLQLGLGNAWDFAWALDTWPGYEQRYLAWDERTGMALLTMITREHSQPFQPAVRLRALLEEEEYEQVKKLVEDPEGETEVDSDAD